MVFIDESSPYCSSLVTRYWEPDPENPLEPISWNEVRFGHERWLSMLCDYVYTGEV